MSLKMLCMRLVIAVSCGVQFAMSLYYWEVLGKVLEGVNSFCLGSLLGLLLVSLNALSKAERRVKELEDEATRIEVAFKKKDEECKAAVAMMYSGDYENAKLKEQLNACHRLGLNPFQQFANPEHHAQFAKAIKGVTHVGNGWYSISAPEGIS